MRQLICSVCFLALAFPLLADDKDDALKKLNGTYEVVSLMKGGTVEKKEKTIFTIKDGTILIKENDKKEDSAKFTVDATKKPAQIDIKPEKGPKNVVGIYELKETDTGTELTLAFGLDGTERPKDFKGGDSDKIAVIKLFRKKEK